MLLTLIEQHPWEVEVGAHIGLRLWGLGITLVVLGTDAPNSLTLNIGPLCLWLTVWHWGREGWTRHPGA